MKYCLQLNEDDCGFCCLKNLLYRLSHDKRYLRLSQDLKKGAYSFLDLVTISKSEGLELEGYEATVNDLQKNDIALIKVQEMTHYILILKLSKRKVTYFDPKYGILKNDLVWLKERYLNRFLRETNYHKQLKFEERPYHFNYYICVLLYLELMVLMSALIYSEQTVAFIVHLFFILSLELLKRCLLKKEMKRIDQTIITPFIEKVEISKRVDLISLKSNLIKERLKKHYGIITFMALTFILIINDLMYLVFLFVFLTWSLVYFHLMKRINHEKIALSELETQFYRDVAILNGYLKATEIADKIERKMFVYNGLKYLIIFCLTLIYAFIKNNLTLNFILFNFGIFAFFIENANSLLISFDNEHQLFQSEALINSFIKTYHNI